MKARRLGRLWRTLIHLRRAQLIGQLRNRASRSIAPVQEPCPALRLRRMQPAVPFLPAPAHARFAPPGTVRLLHREVRFGPEVDWRFAGEGPLWSYHLHQFDHLRALDLSGWDRTDLMLHWVAKHRDGVGWDPHPTCLRILNWLKLLYSEGSISASQDEASRIQASLASQAATLADHLETHLLANHYLSNLLGLVAAGVAFEGEAAQSWLDHESRLRRELEEQILPDGMHTERSPMYHSLLLESMLDLLNLARGSPGAFPDALEARLADCAARMLGALGVLTHPDGEIALFGDSAFGIAQPPSALRDYASAFGLQEQGPSRPGVLEAGGYVRLERPPFTVIVSVAGPMPSYQPGHAHCDALSFELSVGRSRVVADTGVFEYVPGPRRDWSRATRAHATLEVAGSDQGEIWASHRIGGRPRVACVDVAPGRRVEATCTGWATPRSCHRRVLELGPEGLEIRDTLEGESQPVRFTLPLAPGLGVELDGSTARVGDASTRMEIDLPGELSWKVEEAPYFPEFGSSLPRAVIIGEAKEFRAGVSRIRLGT